IYRSAASVGTARVAPDIIVRMPSRALRVLRIVLSVRFSRPVCGSRSPQIERARDEPGREGTLQHAGQIKLCNSDCNQNRAVIWSFGQLVTTPASQRAWWQVPTRRF